MMKNARKTKRVILYYKFQVIQEARNGGKKDEKQVLRFIKKI